MNEKGKDLETYIQNMEIKGEYDTSLSVKCLNGIFVGKKDGNVISYKGIPYAKPPIKDLRFLPPVKLNESSKVYEAYYFGKVCLQSECESEMSSHYKQGEDCLTLNIWRNVTDTNIKKPVMVFIHGGSFTWGGTADPLYEGTNLLKSHTDIILITINYRVGILGFINLSILENGDKYNKSGNLGILDQICALEWIHSNIENFGGDPNNICIFGESAGGCSVSILPFVKNSKGLFNHVIAQSGSYQFTNSLEDSLESINFIIKKTNAKSVDDLIKLSEDEIKKIINEFDKNIMNFPIRDGIVIPKDLYNESDKFDFKDIDFIIGTNKDEYRYWIKDLGGLDLYKNNVLKFYDFLISKMNNNDKMNINNFMNDLKDDEIWNKTELINEIVFHIPAIAQAEQIYKRGGKVYMYYWVFPSGYKNLEACHAMELSSVFNNLNNYIYSGGNINENLAKSVQKMWINFAKKGNPSIENYEWNCYNLSERNTMILGENIHEEKDVLSERRKLLYSLAKHIQIKYI